jgi:hypothetical protein
LAADIVDDAQKLSCDDAPAGGCFPGSDPDDKYCSTPVQPPGDPAEEGEHDDEYRKIVQAS